MKGMSMTYDADIQHGHLKTSTGWTLGGYSGSQTVHERCRLCLCVRELSVVRRFIVTIPPGYPMEAAGPVFCAGITMYSPLVDWKVRRRRRCWV